LNVFLESRGIRHPGQVRRDTCLAYPGWRRKVPHLNSGKKLISPNTVILELKVLGKILFEAFVRGWIPANPCTRLKLQRVPSAVKSEITDAQVATIQAAIERRLQRAKTVQEKERANFLWTSFEVARLQGIRMSETCFRLDEVDFDNGTVLIHGKGNKVATVPLNPALVPLLQSLKAEGKEFTYNMPTRLPGLIWWKFFNELRRKDPSFKRVSFHSTRVSLISRMERAGAPESIVMSLVLHSSTTIHRVYRRVAPKELVPFWAAAGQASDHKSSPPENPDALPATPKPEPAPSGARG
jgi:integrase